MTAPNNTSLQANFKLPNGDLINVYGDSAADFEASLKELAARAQLILDTGNLLRGAQTVVDAGLTGAPAPQQQAQAVQQYQQSAAQAPPQQQAAPAPSGGPVCKHGPMTYRSGTKNGKSWSAHFCPAPKGAADQCDPLWGRD